MCAPESGEGVRCLAAALKCTMAAARVIHRDIKAVFRFKDRASFGHEHHMRRDAASVGRSEEALGSAVREENVQTNLRRATLGRQERLARRARPIGLTFLLVLVAFAVEGKELLWTLDTSDTQLTLSVSNDRPVIRHLRAVESRHDWIETEAPVPLMVSPGGSKPATDGRFKTSHSEVV